MPKRGLNHETPRQPAKYTSQKGGAHGWRGTKLKHATQIGEAFKARLTPSGVRAAALTNRLKRIRITLPDPKTRYRSKDP